MLKIGITNHPSARRLPHPIKTIIAGAAPTAHLLAQLESKGFQPVHVYGLTYVDAPLVLPNLSILSRTRKLQRDLWSLHSQLPPAFLDRTSRVRTSQTCCSSGACLRHLFPTPCRSFRKTRSRTRRRSTRRQDGRRDRRAWQHRHAGLPPRPRRDSSRVRWRILPLRGFGRVAPRRVGADSGQDEGYHHLRRRGV